jgi:hypothetical protein
LNRANSEPFLSHRAFTTSATEESHHIQTTKLTKIQKLNIKKRQELALKKFSSNQAKGRQLKLRKQFEELQNIAKALTQNPTHEHQHELNFIGSVRNLAMVGVYKLLGLSNKKRL